MSLKKITVKELGENPFELIGDKWTLITAGGSEAFNTMTASWGGLGVLWNMPVATVYIRPERYTNEFARREDYFTLSFFKEGRRDALALCGSKSGRDIDKFKECGFTPAFAEAGGAYIAEADVVLVCRKLYAESLKAESFLDDSIEEKFYGGHGGLHEIFIGEIVEALVKD